MYNDLLFILYLHTPIVLWTVNNLTCTIQFWSITFQFLYHSVKNFGVDASLSQFPLMIEFAGPCWDRFQGMRVMRVKNLNLYAFGLCELKKF